MSADMEHRLRVAQEAARENYADWETAISENASLRARLAEAEREIAEYEAANRDLVRRSDYWKAEAERLTKERDRWHVMAVQQVDFKIAANDRAEAAEAALAKVKEALEKIAETDVIYPPHDPGNYFAPEGREGPCAKIARAALAPDGKTEAELRHDCAASGRHDHDGCDCSAEELARRAALTLMDKSP